jgi:hypothetical protein
MLGDLVAERSHKYRCAVSDYDDGRVRCGADAVVLRGYYLPWGSKRIPYGSIRDVRRVQTGALRGRARIWGTANPGLWANFDPQRPKKKIALILDLGKKVKPFLTPEDPDAVETLIRERTGLGPATGTPSPGPLI